MPVRLDLFRAAHETVTHPTLTDEMVRHAESLLGVKLPQTYLEALRMMNGGYLRYDCIVHGGKPIEVRTIIGIGHSDNGLGNGGILDNQYFIDEWQLPGGLVLIDGDGHTWTALDYRQGRCNVEPPVIWIETDGGEELLLAPNFQDFTDRLVDGEYRRIYGFAHSDKDAPTLRHQLECILGVTWEPFGGGDTLQGTHAIWKGTLRKDEGAHFLLRLHRCPEGLSYPAHPECRWILMCDIQSQFRDVLDATLRSAGLNPILLHEPHYEF